jgi:16S rRNA G966 N2-methylase RsmD
MFSMVGQDLTGMTVLDAYGGSGVLAVEAWSRGGDVVICERNPKTVRAIERVVAAFDAPIVVRQADVERARARIGAFDLVLADPPYARDPSEVLGLLGGLVRKCLVLETSPGHVLPEESGGLKLDRHRTYGHCDLWLFKREKE